MVVALAAGLAAPVAAGAAGDGYVDPEELPCVLVDPAAVADAVGITDSDGVGTATKAGGAGVCIYGQSPGAILQVANDFGVDGGRQIKELCRLARDHTTLYSDYVAVKGVGKTACAYSQVILGKPTRLLIAYALRKGSASAGREIQLRVAGTADEMAAVAPGLDAGLATLARSAARFVRTEAIGS